MSDNRETHKQKIVVEIKDRVINGPTVDQITGTAERVKRRFILISDIIIICRGFTSDAEKRRDEVSTPERQVSFNVVGRESPTK
jgi:hypothetical protein